MNVPPSPADTIIFWLWAGVLYKVQVHTLGPRPPTKSFRSRSFLARIGKLESLENNLLHWNPATTPVVWEALVRRLARVDVSLQFLQSIFVFKNDFLFSESGSRPSLLRYSWICPWSVSSHRSSTLSVGNNDRQTNGTMNGAVCQLLT